MLSFLVSFITNPTVITAATAAAVWLWHKARGDKQQSLKDLAAGFARQAVTELVDQPDAASKASDYIEAKIVDGATKLGIPASVLAAAQPLLDPIVQHAVADLLEQLKARAQALSALQQHMAELADQIAKIGPDMKAAEAKGLADGRATFAATAEVAP